MTPKRIFSDEVSHVRQRFILATEKRWVSGSTLRYFFMQRSQDQNVVRRAFSTWEQYANLKFVESQNPRAAEIRIAFTNQGSWSYIGRDVLGIQKNQPTMNFGWPLQNDFDTALHEIGHTLGLYHEHQNPNAGIVWNRAAVVRELSGPPNNWDLQTIENNILSKVPTNGLDGSTWDRDSIMHYPFGPGLISEPSSLRGGLTPQPGLSPLDIEWARRVYPFTTPNEPDEPQVIEVLEVPHTMPLRIAPGGEVAVEFKVLASGEYVIETKGEADTVIVLQYRLNGKWQTLAGDDDSGLETNARISFGADESTEYRVACRLFWKEDDSRAKLVIRSADR